MTDRGTTERHDRAEGRRARSTGAPVTRDDVIAAALRAVRREGPGVSMNAIAAEAGVTKPIVYRTVGDKEAVAEAVAEHLSRHVDEVMLAALRSAGDRHDGIHAANLAFFRLLEEERNLFLFVEYGWGSHDGVQLESMIDRSARLLVRVLDDADSPTAAPSARATTWSYGAVGALRTMAVMWVRRPHCEIEHLAADATTFLETIIDGATSCARPTGD